MNRSRVESIARSRTMLTDDQISQMETTALWKEIYATAPPRKTPDNRPTFFPTGFSKPDKVALVELARELGFRKTSDVNGATDFVVTGEAPGAGRLKKAKAFDCTVLTRAQFLAFAKYGVVEVSDEEARGLLESDLQVP